MAQQLGPQVEAATAPYPYALSTRAGECVAHLIQGLCELNPNSTVMSIDGISAYDQISRAAMLDGLYTHCGGKAIPRRRTFGKTLKVWSTPFCKVKAASGDPLMPLLYSLGQHGALEATQEELADGENLIAYLDIWVVSPVPDRVSHVYGSLQRNLFSHARIRVHGGKTQVWNRSGIRPAGCNALERIAQTADPRARVWRGSGETDLPPSQQGIVVLDKPQPLKNTQSDFVSWAPRTGGPGQGRGGPGWGCPGQGGAGQGGPEQAMVYFGQFLLWPFLLWPILLWPILLWPVLLWPVLLRPVIINHNNNCNCNYNFRYNNNY